MNTQKIGRRIFVFLIKVFTCMVFFSLIGFISYKATLYFYGNTQEAKPIKKQTGMNTVAEATIDNIAVNVIYAVDENTAQITDVVVEIFDTDRKSMDLLTIPAELNITMSAELYEKISSVNEIAPQIIGIKELSKFFSQEVVYEYGNLLLEEALDTNVSFYTTMKKSTFDKYFNQRGRKESLKGIPYQFTEEFVTKLEQLATEDEFIDAMHTYYENIQSNLSEAKRRSYIPKYLYTDFKLVHSYFIEGEWDEDEFFIADDAVEQMRALVEHTWVEKETEELPMISSKGATIQLLNGSMITGLAATYRQMFEDDGYNISNVGNYTGEVLETTRILVSEEGLGQDLAMYFSDPVIEVDPVPSGYDIKIILGKNDIR